VKLGCAGRGLLRLGPLARRRGLEGDDGEQPSRADVVAVVVGGKHGPVVVEVIGVVVVVVVIVGQGGEVGEELVRVGGSEEEAAAHWNCEKAACKEDQRTRTCCSVLVIACGPAQVDDLQRLLPNNSATCVTWLGA